MKELSAPRGQRRRGGGDEDRTRAAAESVRLEGQVDRQILDRETLCAMARGRRCDVSLAVSRGLFETGLKPVFPDGLQCRDIDVAYSVDLSRSRSREAYHGGIDIPAPFRTPIIAAAAGTVVAKFSGEESNRGISVILRHSPKETGLPIWTYTEYAHLDKMPHLTLGQVVRMGEVLGVTGNSGTQPRRARRERRPAIHFAVWYSKDPRFAVLRRVVAPVGGYWMDPNALYRIGPPFDSHSLKELRDNEKKVPVAVMTESGDVIPSNAKIVWPYRCKRS